MYVKLFQSILDSSVWAEDYPTRIVWITMLAMADPEGVVRTSTGGLAHRARVTHQECRQALQRLTGPDPESRSQVYAGRRIEPVEGGWLLLNYRTYRETKLSGAERARRYRQRHKDLATPSRTVTPRHVASRGVQNRTQEEVEAEEEEDHPSPPPPHARDVAAIPTELTTEGQEAIGTLLPRIRNVGAFTAELRMIVAGARNVHPPPTWEAVSLALVDLVTADVAEPTPNVLRAFVRKAGETLATANGKPETFHESLARKKAELLAEEEATRRAAAH